MTLFKKIWGIALLAIFFAACNGVDFKKTRAGVPYKIFPGKNGKKIVLGDIVKFHVTQKIGDSVRFSTYAARPEYLKVDSPAAGYEKIKENLLDVFPKAKTGDSLYFVQVIDSFLTTNPDLLKQDSSLKKGDKLITMIRIVDVFKTQEEVQADMQKEQTALIERMDKEQLEKLKNDPKIKEQLNKDAQIIEAYLQKNGIQAQKTGFGTYVEMQKPGSGPQLTKGKYVTMFYNGTTLDGKFFDGNMGKEPATFQLVDGGLIRGFLEGLLALSKGAKAKLIIPSSLSYGSQGRPPQIGPDQNLVFDVEIIDVSDTQPIPPQPQRGDPRNQRPENH